VGEGRVPSREEVEAALSGFRGKILQKPPEYSAVHLGGKRAYELARSGEVPEMKERPVTVYKLELLSWEVPCASVLVRCSAGTYIRSLARDIALAAGSRAHLGALTRTRIGGFRLEDAFEPPAGEEGPDAGITLAAAVQPITAGTFTALGIPRFDGDRSLLAPLIHGRPLGPLLAGLELNDSPGGEPPAAAVFAGGQFAALVKRSGGGGWSYGFVYARLPVPGGVHADP
jgi:tRNA pseudouridine55 synthase